MSTIFATHALLPDGWQDNVRIAMAHGQIATVTPNASAEPDDQRADWLLPGMPNLHSHAFQRAMAGRAERRGETLDTFWTWREEMYRFALAVNPDDVEAIATFAYLEMLERGFTRVGEFHYLHHDADGRPYTDLGEMSGRIAAGAARSGIRLTLLPSFYAHANFGGAPPHPGQRRFICDPDRFVHLFERATTAVTALPGATIGVAPHSLSAVTPEELAQVLSIVPDGPVHIHAAEQVREVVDCLAWSGSRPVAWLLDHHDVDHRWCLIHATHLDADETSRLAIRGAVAGLCPVTEANLGDGIFPAPPFVAAGGAYGIGTDSNVLTGVSAELRQLEYAQRLGARQRNVMATGPGSTARALYDAALAGGARALAAPAARIGPGHPADLVALSRCPWIPDNGDTVLDTWVFSNEAVVAAVWVGGDRVVSDGRHRDRDDIAARFRQAMGRLDRV